MRTGLDLKIVTVTIQGEFFGPNFVRGLAEQNGTYDIVSDTQATLQFSGGFDPDITLFQIVIGTGFGFDEDTGRYSGRVTGYYAYEIENPANGWTFSNLDVSLDVLNSNASDPNVTFPDLLVVPLRYEYVGGTGDDFYILGSFDDIAKGNDGDDQFIGLTGNDTLIGGAGDDILVGNQGDDTARGGGGADWLAGGIGTDALDGGNGSDLLYGGDGDDALDGGNGKDFLFGGAGGDALDGGDGDDLIRGGADTDIAHGGDGDDLVFGGKGDDKLHGDAGDDVLHGGKGTDTIYGGKGNDQISGGADTNYLYGNRGKDTLTGNSGTDQLFGGAGDDILTAGTAADFINGGTGNDTLSGGIPGGDHATDNFIFEGTFGDDVITDFEVGFDGILFAVGIDPADVSAATDGDDVVITVDSVDLTEVQTIRLLDVAGTFDLAIDVGYM